MRGDPRATILKMQQVVRAALAPADPSSQDQQVAAAAAAAIARARVELAIEAMGQAEGAGRSESESNSAAVGSEPGSLSQVLQAYRAALKTPETSSVNLVACVDCGHAHWR